MNRSESLKELTIALSKAQAVMKPAPKDSQNPAFRSRYADLASVWDACRDALTQNGLAVLQMPSAEGNAVTITTTLLHTSGEWVSEPLTMTAKDASPQSIGSAITYGRRYGLAAAVGVCPEDDDGNAASQPGGEVHEAYRPQPARAQAPPQRPQANGNGNGHQGHDQPRQYDGPPKSGKALFAALKDLEQKMDIGLIKYINSWAKLQDWPARMVDFDSEQVALAYAEAMRKVQSIRSGDEVDAARGREPGQEG